MIAEIQKEKYCKPESSELTILLSNLGNLIANLLKIGYLKILFSRTPFLHVCISCTSMLLSKCPVVKMVNVLHLTELTKRRNGHSLCYALCFGKLQLPQALALTNLWRDIPAGICLLDLAGGDSSRWPNNWEAQERESKSKLTWSPVNPALGSYCHFHSLSC